MSRAELEKYSLERDNAAGFVARQPAESVGGFIVRASQAWQEALESRSFYGDETDALYVYGIEYSLPADLADTAPKDERRSRYLLLGVVGGLALSPESSDSVAVHEATFADRVDERLRLMKATGMSFAPIMAGYVLPDHAINNALEKWLGIDRRSLQFHAGRPPVSEARIGSTVHRTWRIDSPSLESRIVSELRSRRFLILDGHHRFAAATAIHRSGAATYPLTMAVESHDRALWLSSWHRVVGRQRLSYDQFAHVAAGALVQERRLDPSHETDRLAGDLAEARLDARCSFVVVAPDRSARYRGNRRTRIAEEFDVLHSVLEREFGIGPDRCAFVPSPAAAANAVRSPESPEFGGVAFLLPSPTVAEVEGEAFATRRLLAAKSTMFLPKVADGILFAPLGEAAGRHGKREGPSESTAGPAAERRTYPSRSRRAARR